MKEVPAFIPPHELTDTYWNEFLGEGAGVVRWSFEEGGLRLELPNGSQQLGRWSIAGDSLTIEVPEGGQIITYTAELAKPVKVLHLLPTEPIRDAKQLRRSGQAFFPETGQFSREWNYYWIRYVPNQGQADTVQGEILRVTHRLAAMYSNSGGGSWSESSATYDAFAEVTIATLCDGSLGESTTAFVREVVTQLQRYCRAEDELGGGPHWSDVDRLADLAVEWCKRHPLPIRREHDHRMQF